MTRRKKVDIDNLPSNSRFSQEPKEIKPITSGRVRRRSAGGLANTIRNIGNALFSDVVIPSLRSTALDFLHNGIDMFAEGYDVVRGFSSGPKRHRSYHNMYRSRSRKRQLYGRESPRRAFVEEPIYEDFFFEEREDAQLVLARLFEIVAEYGQATIGDLYSLVGVASNHTKERWGWDSLDGSRIKYSQEGFYIDFPEPDYFN